MPVERNTETPHFEQPGQARLDARSFSLELSPSAPSRRRLLIAAVELFCRPTSQGNCTSCDPILSTGRSWSSGCSLFSPPCSRVAHSCRSRVQKSRIAAAMSGSPPGRSALTVQPTISSTFACRSDHVSGKRFCMPSTTPPKVSRVRAAKQFPVSASWRAKASSMSLWKKADMSSSDRSARKRSTRAPESAVTTSAMPYTSCSLSKERRALMYARRLSS